LEIDIISCVVEAAVIISYSMHGVIQRVMDIGFEDDDDEGNEDDEYVIFVLDGFETGPKALTI